MAAASYKSGSSGRITIAYLSEGEYTLTEISAPKGYAAVAAPIHITLSLNEETGAPDIAVSGIGTDYYSIRDDETGTMAAVITIRNRSNDLQVKKIDEETNTPISGVRFALYRQVTGVDGVKRKDYLPMRGYENLVTDVNGVLTQITMALDAGTYYLTETQAAENYELLSEDLCFTIGADADRQQFRRNVLCHHHSEPQDQKDGDPKGECGNRKRTGRRCFCPLPCGGL